MLDAAGYTKAADGNRIDPTTAQGNEPPVRRAERRSRASSRPSQFVQGYLQAVGIKTTTKLVDVGQAHRPGRQRRGRHLRMGLVGVAGPDVPALHDDVRPARHRHGQGAGRPAGPTRTTATRPTTRSTSSRARTVDPTQRKPMIQQMQQMLYTDAPYIVLFYPDDLEAYNSAKWTGVVQQPANDGPGLRPVRHTTRTGPSTSRRPRRASTKSGGGSAPCVLDRRRVVVVVVVVGVSVRRAAPALDGGRAGVATRDDATHRGRAAGGPSPSPAAAGRRARGAALARAAADRTPARSAPLVSLVRRSFCSTSSCST